MIAGLVADRRRRRLAGAGSANWDLALFAVLLAFSVFSDLTAVATESKVKVSGSFLAMVAGDGLPRRHARPR